MIEVENVSMKYPINKSISDILCNPFSKRDYLSALKGVNLKVNKGETIALLGENGAGKTSLLKLLGGLLYPSKGKILVNGMDTVRKNLSVRKKIGYVINEERSFYWRLTGFENLEFFAILDNIFGKRKKSKIHEMLDLVGLINHKNTKVANYSSGMKQKLAIARGLLKEPEILLLDEPTKSLDPISAIEIRNILNHKINEKEKTTLVVTTHNIDEVEALCETICIIANGKISKKKRIRTKTEKEVLQFYKKYHQQIGLETSN